MLDQDGNERIDKEEFKVLETVFSSAARERKTQQIAENSEVDQQGELLSLRHELASSIGLVTLSKCSEATKQFLSFENSQKSFQFRKWGKMDFSRLFSIK